MLQVPLCPGAGQRGLLDGRGRMMMTVGDAHKRAAQASAAAHGTGTVAARSAARCARHVPEVVIDVQYVR